MSTDQIHSFAPTNSDNQSPLRSSHEALALIANALRLSTPALRMDPSQLASQLVGRLSDFTHPVICRLVKQAKESARTSWLCPLRSCLEPPSLSSKILLAGHTAAITGIAVCCAQRRVVTASWDGTIRLWDALTGQQLHVIRPKDLIGSQNYSAHRMAWNACRGALEMDVCRDGRRAIVLVDGTFIQVAELQDVPQLESFPYDTDSIGCIAISPNGGHAAFSDRSQGSIVSIDLNTRSVSGSIPIPSDLNVHQLKIAGDGHIVYASVSSSVDTWTSRAGIIAVDMRTGTERAFFESPWYHRRSWGTSLYRTVTSFDVSTDGCTLLALSEDGFVRVWDTETPATARCMDPGDEYRRSRGSSAYGPLYSSEGLIAISADGASLLAALTRFDRSMSAAPSEAIHEQDIMTWRLGEATHSQKLFRESAKLSALSWGSDASVVLVGTKLGKAFICSGRAESSLVAVDPNVTSVTEVVTSERSSRIMSMSDRKDMIVWDTDTATPLYELSAPDAVAVAMLDDGCQAVVATPDSIRIVDTLTGDTVRSLTGFSISEPLVVGRGGHSMCVRSSANAFVLWHVGRGKGAPCFYHTSPSEIKAMDSRGTLFIVRASGRMEVCRPRVNIRMTAGTFGLSVSTRRPYIDFFHSGGQPWFRLWSLRHLTPLRVIEPLGSRFVAVSSDLRRIYFGFEDGRIAAYASRSGKVIAEYNPGLGIPLALRERRQAEAVVVGTSNGDVGLIDLRRKRVVLHMGRHRGSVRHLASDVMGQRVLSAASDGTLRLYDMSDRRTDATFRMDGEPVRCLLSSNGQTAVCLDSSRRLAFLRLVTC